MSARPSSISGRAGVESDGQPGRAVRPAEQAVLQAGEFRVWQEPYETYLLFCHLDEIIKPAGRGHKPSP